jgi:hypothetical protein
MEAALLAICLTTGSDISECNSRNRFSLSELGVKENIATEEQVTGGLRLDNEELPDL